MSTLRATWSQPDRALAGLLAAMAVFTAGWALLHQRLLEPPPISDTATYQSYGDAVRQGEVPYRDFGVEYPPGALPVFVAPTYAPNYDHAFDLLMAALGLACVVLVAAAGAAPWGVAFVAVSPLLVGTIAYSRYDLWPAALVAGAMAALVSDRHRLGWALLGAAVAAKLYPAVLVPLALLWTQRRAGARELTRAAAIGAAVLAVALVPFLALAPGGLWSSVSDQLTRPLQIESLAASALTTFGRPLIVDRGGSQSIAGHVALAAVMSTATTLALAALWAGFARGPAERGRLVRYAAACVCAFIAFGKVFSPQYLIWLVPLVPLVRGRRGLAATGVLAACLVATQVWFPLRYWDYVDGFELAWVVLLRNLLVVALLAVLSFPARAPSVSPAPASSSPSASSA
jgi:uncharacterized membrane protein